MAGLTHKTPVPIDITVHETSRNLQLDYADGKSYKITFELMRVYSPSAEVQGHGPGQEVLQTGKALVQIVGLEPVAITQYNLLLVMGTAAVYFPGNICITLQRSRQVCGRSTRRS